MHTQKQFSLACERNQDPILQHLQEYLADAQQVLEIGSGTGQHAVHFCRHLPHLKWQTSDRVENHTSIQAWINEEANSRTLAPIALDVANDSWPTQSYDAVFTANTCHIMHWEEVEKMFAGARQVLAQNGTFIVYGPFNYGGQFTSVSNQEFDASLKRQSSHRGIRDIADVTALAMQQQFKLLADLEMPANNRLLIFKKTA